MFNICRAFGFFEFVDDLSIDLTHFPHRSIAKSKNSIVRPFDLDDGRSSAFLASHVVFSVNEGD